MKKYYLFDLDGTLTDPKEGITKSVQYALNKFNIETDCDELTKFIGPPLKRSFMNFYKMNDSDSDMAIKFYRERYAALGIFENKLFDDVIPVLEKLKSDGKILAVATCKPTVFAKKICDKYEISRYFSTICGTELDGTLTTKTEVINNVLVNLNAAPKDCVMIGDRMHDIEGAKNFNMTSVGVTFGYAQDGELEEAGADYIIDNMLQLPELNI